MAIYIDKEEFREDLREYRELCKEWIAAGRPKGEAPRLTDPLWIKFYTLATKLGSMPSFAQYPFSEEMISEAIDRCMNNATLFDPDAVIDDKGKLVDGINAKSSDMIIWFDGQVKLPTSGMVIVGGERIRFKKRSGSHFYQLDRITPIDHSKGTIVEVPTSPFSYFTATITRRFYQYIDREKAETSKKELCQEHFEICHDNGIVNGSGVSSFEYARHYHIKNRRKKTDDVVDEVETEFFEDEENDSFYY